MQLVRQVRHAVQYAVEAVRGGKAKHDEIAFLERRGVRIGVVASAARRLCH